MYKVQLRTCLNILEYADGMYAVPTKIRFERRNNHYFTEKM